MDNDEVLQRLVDLSQENGISAAAVGREIGVSRSQAAHIFRGHSGTTWERLERWAPLVGRRVVHHLVTREAAGPVRLILREISTLGLDDLRRVSRVVRLLPKISDRERVMLDHELNGWEAILAYDDRAPGEPQQVEHKIGRGGHGE